MSVKVTGLAAVWRTGDSWVALLAPDISQLRAQACLLGLKVADELVKPAQLVGPDDSRPLGRREPAPKQP